MASGEVSPAPSGLGLKGMLAKARRNKLDNSSTTSFPTSEGSNESHSLRDSMDSALEKIKNAARKDNDPSETSSGVSIAKLIPGTRKRKERKRRAKQEAVDAEGPRGRSAGDGEGATATGLSSENQSILDDDDGSSLMTEDSEEEHTHSAAPPLISHESHIGYLTSSSPVVKAATITEESISPPLNHTPLISVHPAGNINNPPTSTRGQSINNNFTSEDIFSPGPLTGESTYSVDSLGSGRSVSRSVSPGFRLKEAFKPGSRKNSTQNGSPERKSGLSGTGNSLGALFSKDRTNSISSRRSSKVADSITAAPAAPAVLKTMNTEARSSNKSLPSLSTVPRTPPRSSLEAPITTVTPPTPVDRGDEGSSAKPLSTKSDVPPSLNSPDTATSTKGNLPSYVPSHRRVRSDSATHQPSKLSNAMSAPLTPMMEETKTPGSRTTSGNAAPSTGFFSSVFVAAQNAANTFTNTIGNNQSRSRSGTGDTEERLSEIPAISENQDAAHPIDQPRKLAIDTIGSGDLSLSQLGISSDALSQATTAVSPALTSDDTNGDSVHREEAAARAEDVFAARAVSVAYGEKADRDTTTTPIAEDTLALSRPKSNYEPSVSGDKTPPNGSIYEGESGGIFRNASIRSKVDKVKRRRNGSNSTGTTIGAMISASHNTLMSPGVNSSVPKLTGFAVASKKRNRDFHQLFRSVPEDDYLIEDYSCALQRDIILAGRIYVSEGHICFSSNILGWITTLVISFDEVVSVEKETTAMVFPNAIAIQTLHARHTFRSLLSREATYDLLIGIWKISHPGLQSSENGVKLVNGGTGTKTEKVEPSESGEGSEGSEDDEDVYDEDDEDDEGAGSFVETLNGSMIGSEPPEPQQKSVARKASAVGVAAGQAAGSVPTPSEAKSAEKAGAAAAAATEFPGPQTHAPTECTDSTQHYSNILKDEVIPAPLGKIYSMLFGPSSGGFVTRFLLDEVKAMELQLEDDKKGLSGENKSRTYSYIKPLSGAIGPKKTKCITTEVLDFIDLERSASVTVTTQTPDVPSGSVFSTKTRYCIMWGPDNSTRLIMSCMIEWTGKSWLKSPIESGANDGQLTYANDLVKSLRAGLSSRPRAGTSASRMKKGRKKKGDVDDTKASAASKANEAATQKFNWGPLEPLHDVLSPVLDILQPLLTAQSLIGLLLFLLIISWFRNSRLRASSSIGPYSPGLTAQRVAAYEEIWRAEESALWDWLEERVGMSEGGGFAYPAAAKVGNGDASKRAKDEKREILKSRGMKTKLNEIKGAGEREIDWAIGVTEEKLKVLKGVVERGRGVGEVEEKEQEVSAGDKKLAPTQGLQEEL
ncbi:hypothetical protein MMC17_006596 [Xylographa soralifera]|nr:hypothetical protein [Xylographa soralifera]